VNGAGSEFASLRAACIAAFTRRSRKMQANPPRRTPIESRAAAVAIEAAGQVAGVEGPAEA
jgi:hypothetical protein